MNLEEAQRRRKTNRTILAVVGGVGIFICGLAAIGAIASNLGYGDDQAAQPAATAQSSAPVSEAPVESPRGAATVPIDVRMVYIADLNNIDKRIVGRHSTETMVGRGLSQCDSISKYPNDRKKLLDLTNFRFTAPERPEGFGTETAGKILAVVHQHLCPALPLAKT